MSTVTDALRNNFIVSAQQDAGLTYTQAAEVAEFFATVGDRMLRDLSPVLSKYKEQISITIRNQIIDEILEELNNGTAFVQRKTLVTKLKTMRHSPVQTTVAPVVPIRPEPRPVIIS